MNHADGCAVDECDCGVAAFEELQAEALRLPADKTTALVRVRVIFDRLGKLAIAAADERWPGFETFTQQLIRMESAIAGTDPRA